MRRDDDSSSDVSRAGRALIDSSVRPVLVSHSKSYRAEWAGGAMVLSFGAMRT